MAQGQTLRVKGYKELMRGLARADKATRKEVRAALRKTGEGVRKGASERILSVDTRTAAGYKVRVRQRGIAVEQSIRKTTGLHPEYGALQMRRALVPALDENLDRLDRDMGEALDKIARAFAL